VTTHTHERAQEETTRFVPTLGHYESPDHGVEKHRVERVDLIRVVVVAAAAVLTMAFPPVPSPILLAFGAAVLTVGAWPVLREAVQSLLERRMTMELSMTIALVAALVTGQVFVALVIAAFVLGAEVLETMALSRGRHAIRDLLEYLPRTAVVRRGTGTEVIPFEDLTIGDLVLVNPGGSIPVDGTVIAGTSHVDEATITGEPMPASKVAGDLVYAGTVNQHGALEVRAERIGSDSTFGKIVEAVERAEQSRAPVQKMADRLAGFLVLYALAAAAVTFILTQDATSTISVIIVTGACGVAAGTPLAILAAIGRAARHGSIVKGGRHVEALWAVNTVVLDKTGTLTFGRPTIRGILPANGTSSESIISTAAVAELRSEHPIARAVVEHARNLGVTIREPDHFQSVPGRGVTATVDGSDVAVGTRAFLDDLGIPLDELVPIEDRSASEVVVALDRQALGSLLVADMLRDEAVAAVRDLRAMGIWTVLLTGDRPATAALIARQLGVDEFAGGMLPDQKLERVRTLIAQGRTVAMVGDGVNDAPALAAASVGVAMGSGTDVTRESADVVLIGNDLSKFVETLRVSRKTRRVIVQNFAGTIAVDTLGVVLAAFGILGPLLAAFIHVGSELAFILNSVRLVPPPRPSSGR